MKKRSGRHVTTGVTAILSFVAVLGTLVLPTVQTPVAGSSGPSVSASPLDGAEPMNEGPLEHVFTRTVNGITVRVYTSPPTGEPNASPGFVVAEMSNDAAVGVGRAENCYAAGPRASGTFGGPENSPVEWVIVQSFDVPSTAGVPVRAQFGGGADEMVPVRGIAVLVAPGAGGTVLVEGPGGGGSTTIGQVVETDDAICQPPTPPTLPPAGTPPADVAAAEAGIRQAYVDAFTGSNPDEVKWRAVEDGERLTGARQEQIRAAARQAGFSDEQLAAMTVQTSDISFVDETHAAITFTIDVPGHTAEDGPLPAGARVGYAVFVDGRWKVARETQCENLQRIDVNCP